MNQMENRISWERYIGNIDKHKRKEFLDSSPESKHIFGGREYRWTASQNNALYDFLQNNPNFRKKWEEEVMNIQSQISVLRNQLPFGTGKQGQNRRIYSFAEQIESNKNKRPLENLFERIFNPNVFTMEASAYDPRERGGRNNATNGERLRYSRDDDGLTSCAANWGKFPPGTILRIDGKKHIVEDYGSFILDYPNRIDRFVPFSSKNVFNPRARIEVLQWGDFAEAVRILSTRNPAKHEHVRMMLKQAREKLKKLNS